MVRRPPNTLCVSPSFAALHHAPLQVMFCWQLKDLGVVKGYENAVAPISVGQAQAERMLDELLDSVQVSSANIPDDFQIESHAFHIPASEGAYRGFPLRTSSSGRFARLVRSGRAFPWIGFQANHQLRRLHRHRRALTA